MIAKARPNESREFLLNPHKGCATFQHFNGDPLFPGTTWSEWGPTEFPPAEKSVVEGYLPSTVAYCRWYWQTFEPEEGRFDWSMVEGALKTAGERGQTLQVRLMPHGSDEKSRLPDWYIRKYPTRPGTQKRTPYIEAVYGGPEYIEKWGNVIRAFGEKFDGRPDLESVDMAFIGPWGEGAGECSREAVEKITSTYMEAHKKTLLLAMSEEYKMEVGVKRGSGWRCDCFGDLLVRPAPEEVPEHLRWNHMYDLYPMAVCECKAQNAWMKGPVVFESCAVPMSWYQRKYDLDFIIEQGLKYHCTVLMPKYTALPEPWMDKLRKFSNDIGYRFVVRQFQCDGAAVRGVPFEYMAWIENVGVAPIYRRYDFALRFVQGKRSRVCRAKANILKWLPGDAFLRERAAVPKTFERGRVEVFAGVVERGGGAPKVRLANEDNDAEGWLHLLTLDVE